MMEQYDEELYKMMFNIKPCQILIKLHTGENYASQLSRQVEATYSHTVKILQRLESHGLVESEEKGRKKIFKLTSEGEKLAENLKQIFLQPVEI